MQKIKEIQCLINQGKTTREIAQELRVSLRDIGIVRKQMGVDLGAFDRQKMKLEGELASLVKDREQIRGEIAELTATIAKLSNQIRELEKSKNGLDIEIQRKKTEAVSVQQPVDPIYFPVNWRDVEAYLQTLSHEQLRALQDRVAAVHFSRVRKSIEDDTARKLKETRDRLGLSRD